jgi:hypothetical protein
MCAWPTASRKPSPVRPSHTGDEDIRPLAGAAEPTTVSAAEE